jgi:hypothetical protein
MLATSSRGYLIGERDRFGSAVLKPAFYIGFKGKIVRG